MKSFKQFLAEKYINLFGDHPDKHKYADEAYSLLQKSYEPIGGIKGNGFKDKHDMIKNIHGWKLTRRGGPEGKITSAVFYKQKGGRKMVAAATNQTDQGKKDLMHTIGAEFSQNRSHMEVSGPLLHAVTKHLGNDIHHHARSAHEVKQQLGDEVSHVDHSDPLVQKYPHLKDYMYSREIGGKKITKIMLGPKRTEKSNG